MEETVPKVKGAADVTIVGLMVSLNRMERGKGDLSAVQEVDRDFGLKVYSIVTIQDIIDALREGIVPGGEYLDKMLKYREEYGV